MSKSKNEIEGFKAKFHGWYNIEPPPLPRSPKANTTSSFSSVDSKTPLKNIYHVCGRLDYEMGVAEYENHMLLTKEKELVDLNGKANEMLYHASKQKMKANTSGEWIPFLNFELSQKRRNHIELYKHSQERNVKMEEERNKGFKDFRQVAKGDESYQPQ
ncbi:hypothetical protein C1H46_035406 [Malus baccata]|uniref:Uncharacterized protein n=1 Tax=Malus baccata TaxID=106549 RepID=A0A540KXV0_MALBA|nr:hypothetical protein C1H46_035406 [Malus baccata]